MIRFVRFCEIILKPQIFLVYHVSDVYLAQYSKFYYQYCSIDFFIFVDIMHHLIQVKRIEGIFSNWLVNMLSSVVSLHRKHLGPMFLWLWVYLHLWIYLTLSKGFSCKSKFTTHEKNNKIIRSFQCSKWQENTTVVILTTITTTVPYNNYYFCSFWYFCLFMLQFQTKFVHQ